MAATPGAKWLFLIVLGFFSGFGFAIPAAQQFLAEGPFGLKPIWADGLLWVFGIWTTAVILKTFSRRYAHISLFCLLLAWLCNAVGLFASLVVALCLVSAYSLGVLVLYFSHSKSPTFRPLFTESLLIGGTFFLGVWGALLHFPVNYPGVYLTLCLIPLFSILRMPAVTLMGLRKSLLALNDWIQSIPFWAWVAGLALIGWTLRFSSFPSVSYDDHAYHLRLWTELLTQHRAQFDYDLQIWSVAPFVTDLLHAGLSIMAGADARSAMNLALGLMVLALTARILQRLNCPLGVQWLLTILMASTPMFGNLLLSLQGELLLSLVALAGLRLAIDAELGLRRQHVLGVLASCALCAGIKLTGVVLGATLLLSLAVRWCSLGIWRYRPFGALRSPALFVLISLAFVAVHSYVLAWWITGNPVFPLYNAFFLSPLIPAENFSDLRWARGFSVGSYVRAFFHTSDFFESGNYTAGWQYLFLLPIAVLALWRPGIPSGFRIALVPLLGYGLVIFSATQYWRYLFPVMPIATVLLGSLFIRGHCLFRMAFLAVTLFCIVLNVIFFTRVSWLMTSTAQNSFTWGGKEHLSRLYAPAAVLTKRVNELASSFRVLYPPETPYGATLHGSPLYVNWYSPSRAARFSSLKDVHDMAGFLLQEDVDFVISDMSDVDVSGTPLSLLREHLAKYGYVLAQEDRFLLYRLSDAPVLYRKALDLRTTVLRRPGDVELLLPLFDGGISAFAEPRVLAVLQTRGAKQARYRVHFNCASEEGFFVAQINWDRGPPYYRLISCKAEGVSFIEAVAVPAGASEGSVHISVRDAEVANIDSVSVELH